MSAETRLLAVIPARGGSKGVPKKNILPLAGLPLIAHTILFAKMCPEIHRCIVSTDSTEIANVAKQYGGDVPFLRPPELAQDDTPMWPVLRHALSWAEQNDGETYDLLMLLDPTSPARELSDVSQAVTRLSDSPIADGIIGVSRPDFNPIWNCVVERDGWMADLFEDAGLFNRRQDAPTVYWINGSLYVWRTGFLRAQEASWRMTDRSLIFEIPQYRSMSIDTQDEFDRAECLVNAGLISLPWMEQFKGSQ